MPAPDPARPRFLLPVLVALLGLQPVTTDLYLPALPTLQADLGAPVAAAQLTLSALIVCFGLAQLAWGPIADRVGRRPVLLLGLGLYVAAALAATVAPDIAWLVAARALQGAGLAAAIACGRAIVRDVYEPVEGARAMARVMTGLGVIAVLSPLAGGLIVESTGSWRGTLLGTALAGAVALGIVALRLGETLPRPDPTATRLARVVGNWRAVAEDPRFVAWTAVAAGTYGGIFVLLVGSAYVYIGVLGVSRAVYGMLLASMSLFYIVGTLLARRLIARHGLAGTVRRGSLLATAGGLSMAALALAGVEHVWAVLLPQWLYAIGHGLNQPCAQVGAVAPFPEKAGTAASLSGFAMMTVAFVTGLVLGAVHDGTTRPMAIALAVFGTGLAVAAWTLVSRLDGPPTAADLPDAAVAGSTV
jgi:DHA1 family bicyclomycin/chloramphenicol resistance-like MFS transporter